MKRTLLAVLSSSRTTLVLVPAALLLVGFITFSELASSESTDASHHHSEVPSFVKDWEDLAAVGRNPGQAATPIQIIVFSDYECPFCKTQDAALRSVVKQHDDVSVSHFNWPLPQHGNAFTAAVAAECAMRQDRFDAYSKLLFDHQDDLGSVSHTKLAQSADIPDLKRFDACVAQEKTRLIVESDRRQAKRLHLEITPTLIVNGTVYKGALTHDELNLAIQQAQAAKQSDSTS